MTRVRYLVTGGAGFLGSAVTRRLSHGGGWCHVLDDLSRGRTGWLHGATCELTVADVRDPAAVTAAMKDCDTVLHFAFKQGTQTFYSEPREVLDVALRGILNVLAACEETGCRDLFLVSSSEAYETPPVWPTPETVPLVVPDPLNPRYSYGGGKIASELAALAWWQAGVLDRVIIARPHNIFGPAMGTRHVIPEFCERMNQLTEAQPDGVLRFPIQGSGQETRSFCYVDDFTAQVMILLAQAPRGAGIWHLGTMEERTVAEVAHAVAACYGRDIKIEPGILPRGSPVRRLPDTAKITGLGWDGPQTSFEDGLKITADWYRAHG